MKTLNIPKIDFAQKLRELLKHKCVLIENRREVLPFFQYVRKECGKIIHGGAFTEFGQYMYID